MLAFLLGQVAAQSQGNCVSQTINFDGLRTFALAANDQNKRLDVSTYDITLDYGAQNVFFTNNGLEMFLARSPTGNGVGARVSTTRDILYGRFTLTLKVPPVGGVVTTFITMSDVKDEIDYEIFGPNTAYTNVFYRGIGEFGIHGDAATADLTQTQVYTIDWNSKRIVWSVNGRPVRTYNNDANAVSPMTPPGQRWYPNTASKVQMAIWDACTDGNTGTCSWARGPINWGGRTNFSAVYQSLQVECYDNNDNIVPKWPTGSSNPDRREAPADQATGAAGPRITVDPSKSIGNGAAQATISVASLPKNFQENGASLLQSWLSLVALLI
ncbi:concanavalin A-like lectin/glucanase domain-containing protein [Gorgonomyces haynaldii]|nr:concanavalin A-like lectin/glucanase domain-containing protein [Gorgonomyces haynaldii]